MVERGVEFPSHMTQKMLQRKLGIHCDSTTWFQATYTGYKIHRGHSLIIVLAMNGWSREENWSILKHLSVRTIPCIEQRKTKLQLYHKFSFMYRRLFTFNKTSDI